MLEDIKKWLEFYKCPIEEKDEWTLEFIIESTQNYIKSYCNISAVPQKLHNVAVNMCLGEFLKRKKSTGELGEFNLDAAIKSIKEGDKEVSFKDSSPSDDERLDALIIFLTEGKRTELNKCRRFSW